jgi:plasmid maintenance system antidote protein VapI
VSTISLATPGKILKYEFLEPMNITPYQLAKNTGMQPIAVSEIIEDKRCSRRLNFDPPCRFNIDPGPVVAF